MKKKLLEIKKQKIVTVIVFRIDLGEELCLLKKIYILFEVSNEENEASCVKKYVSFCFIQKIILFLRKKRKYHKAELKPITILIRHFV